MERDRRLTGSLRGQSDNPVAPPGFELSSEWKVSSERPDTYDEREMLMDCSSKNATSRSFKVDYEAMGTKGDIPKDINGVSRFQARST